MRQDVERIRDVMLVRWDAARHRTVFAGALRSSAQREEQRRVGRWLVLATAALLVVRTLPRSAIAPNESVERAFSTTPRVTDSRRAPSLDDGERHRGEGGFAGTRGTSHGARGNAGTGGGAGTG